MPRKNILIATIFFSTTLIYFCLLSSVSALSDDLPTQETKRLTIAAVGDVMMPLSIQTAVARNKKGYDILFEKIADDLGAAGITFANLETPVDHKADVSGYPKFNSRRGLLTSLKKAGVDIVSVANNHIMDAGVAGLKRTLDNISAAGLVYTGAGKTKKEAAEMKTAAADGIVVGFLAYTYSTNERLPSHNADAPGVNILRYHSAGDLEQAAVYVQHAKKSADLIIVSLHWGDEYATQPTYWQRKTAYELIEAGADIIIGHHPHVLQPIEIYTAGDGRKGLIAYSLGNFISSQNKGVSFNNKDNYRALRGDGIILNITASKSGDKVIIEKIGFIPIWTLRENVGRSCIARPIALAREISNLEEKSTLSREEEDRLMLLRHRHNVITDRLSPPADNH